MAARQTSSANTDLRRNEADEAMAQILDRAFPVGDVGTFTSLIEAINQHAPTPEKMLFDWRGTKFTL